LQLDNDRIAIRERNYVDILDLSLRVIRAHAWPLTLALALGAAPMMLLNHWILADYWEPDFDSGPPVVYLSYMVLLVLWEAPLATAAATLYLGRAEFTQRPQVGPIAMDFLRSLPQLLFYQVLLRTAMVPMVIGRLLLLPPELTAILWLPAMVAWFLLFIKWPYLNEVILLERNPARRKNKQGTSSFRRCRSLHADWGGNLMSRWLGSLTVGGLLLVSFWGSIWIGLAMLTNEWAPDDATFTFYFPLALWLVVGASSVVRFLCYLDLRIRREGWEVELLMRAEEANLTRPLSLGFAGREKSADRLE